MVLGCNWYERGEVVLFGHRRQPDDHGAQVSRRTVAIGCDGEFPPRAQPGDDLRRSERGPRTCEHLPVRNWHDASIGDYQRIVSHRNMFYNQRFIAGAPANRAHDLGQWINDNRIVGSNELRRRKSWNTSLTRLMTSPHFRAGGLSGCGTSRCVLVPATSIILPSLALQYTRTIRHQGPMNRRSFIRRIGLLSTGMVAPRLLRGNGQARPATTLYLPAHIAFAPTVPFPAGKRQPFGWHTLAIAGPDTSPLRLTWPDLPPGENPTRLRIAAGLDERDKKTVEVFLPHSGRVIGQIELWYASQFQLYELTLSSADVAAIRLEGAALRLTRGDPFEVLVTGHDLPDALRPHLMLAGRADASTEFFARLGSLASIQQFGWMEGCVLDGLLDLAALPEHSNLLQTAKRHLSLFVHNGKLIYENYACEPSDGRIYGIEGSLPFAALARLEPQSPLLDLALQFWRSQRQPNGSVQDSTYTSSEGAYTVAYPLAEIARARGSKELMLLALEQIRLRQSALFDGQQFWRTLTSDGRRGNRNWARGIAWQMIGMTRTLALACNYPESSDLVQAFPVFANWIARFQRPDGLWSVFVDEPTLTPDTAGSAGIAAALGIGAMHGWLGPSARAAAARALEGLYGYLTPDGFLGGVSPSNKGGEDLQRSSYRNIFQMGMGLMAQLVAVLDQMR